MILVAFLIYPFLVIVKTWPISEYSIEKAGQFGDSFGVLTSLFSALAFAGIIITIILQKKELELQREELKLTRQELNQSNTIASDHLQYLEAKEQKEDIMQMILKVDENLEYLKSQHLPSGFDQGHTGLPHVSFDHCFGKTYNPLVFKECKSKEQVGMVPQVIFTFTQTVSELYAYLHEYRQRFRERTYTPHVFQYYIRKYREIVQRLNEKGYADERLLNNFGRSFDLGFDAGFGDDNEE